MVQIILLDKIIKYVFIFLVKKSQSVIIAKRIPSGWWNSYIQYITKSGFKYWTYFPGIYETCCIFCSKIFWCFDRRLCSYKSHQNFPLFNVQYCLSQVVKFCIDMYGGLSVHTPQIYCLILSGWVLSFSSQISSNIFISLSFQNSK